MGTQQTLLIILSVIIVGIAFMAGFSLVRYQSYSNNRSLLQGDVQNYLTELNQIYKLVTTFNGISRNLDGVSPEMMVDYIGWSNNPINASNGSFLLDLEPGTPVIYIKAIGKDYSHGKIAAIHGKIEFPEGKISLRVGSLPENSTVHDVDLWD